MSNKSKSPYRTSPLLKLTLPEMVTGETERIAEIEKGQTSDEMGEKHSYYKIGFMIIL